MKQNIKDLLNVNYDKRIAYNQLLEFYETKLYDSVAISSVWYELKNDLEYKLECLNDEIEYLQEQLSDTNALDKQFNNPIEQMNNIMNKTFKKEE